MNFLLWFFLAFNVAFTVINLHYMNYKTVVGNAFASGFVAAALLGAGS